MYAATWAADHAPAGFGVDELGVLPDWMCVSQPAIREGRGHGGHGATHEAGKRPPGHEQMHADVCVAQVVAEVLCKGLDGSFGRVVGCVSWRVRDALLAACYDDGRGGRVGGGGPGLERGDVGV
jgi:hypothetical protein